MKRITSPSGVVYEVDTDLPLGETANFRMYVCKIPDGRIGVLKCAVSIEQNGLLDREAFLLRQMTEEAERREKVYQALKPGAVALNYHLCFPSLVESFVSNDQGGRRINVIGFFGICDDQRDLVPLAHVVTRDNARVDPKTSAWILGKALKSLDFAHSQGIELSWVDGENILINRDDHFVAFFDWSAAKVHPDGSVPKAIVRIEISKIASAVLFALGASEIGIIPPSDQLPDGRYEDFLVSLSRGAFSEAGQAHARFYELVDSLWGRKFHPYTTFELTGE